MLIDDTTRIADVYLYVTRAFSGGPPPCPRYTVGRHWAETHWLHTPSVALYSVVWSGAVVPLNTTTTPPRKEAVASKQEPSMQANQMTTKEDTEATKAHIKILQLKVHQGMTVGCRFLHIFSLTYMILGPYLSGFGGFISLSCAYTIIVMASI
jgi:hypothetical protein